MRAIARPLLVLALLASPASAAEVRSLAESVPLQASRALEIDLPVGQLLLEGTDGATVDVTLSVRCERDRCRDVADRIELLTGRRDDLLTVKVEGLTKGTAKGLEVRLLVEAPRNLPTEIDLAVGDVRVRAMAGDLEVDVGVGEVEVEMARDAVKHVVLDTGVGEARLRTDLGEIRGSGMVGSGLKWTQGTGTASIEIDTGVGEIVVDLR